MPGIYYFSVDVLLKELSLLKKINSLLLFGICDKKDEFASEAYRKNGLIPKALKLIKKDFSQFILIADVCLCGYTSSGHCGIVKKGKIDNDQTLKILGKISLTYAEAGADFVAPSAMMDGQVFFIRNILDKNGFSEVGILSYSAKYASHFYKPFRDVLNSTPKFGDRKTYQMDFRNSKEALREIEEDIKEGADIVMVKPALAYLDIIYQAKQTFKFPLVAYNVSGEYVMIKKMAKNDEEKKKELVLEVITAIKRAGADLIISYFAKDLEEWIG